MSDPADRDPAQRWRHNPFYVLGLASQSTRTQLERETQKLLAMLELRLSGSAHFRSPLGGGVRDAQQVRDAAAVLRSPAERLRAELWATLGPEHPLPEPPQDPVTAPAPAADTTHEPWGDARKALGLGR